MADSNNARGWRRTAIYLLGWWVVLFGLWFLLVDSLAHPEVAAGPLAVLLASLVALGIWWGSDARHRFRVRWLLALRHVPGGVLRDTVVVMMVLWRRLARKIVSAIGAAIFALLDLFSGRLPATVRAIGMRTGRPMCPLRSVQSGHIGD